MVVVGGRCVAELHAQDPWPNDVKLFQPTEEQMLLPDNANCLAVQAFLKMCGLDFEVERRSNAAYMSPSGHVPFIKSSVFMVAELDPIVSFVNTKGVSLSRSLDSSQNADMRDFITLVNTVLANAELYVTWCDRAILHDVTKPRFGSTLPWPLNHILTWQRRAEVMEKLSAQGWGSKTLDEVCQEVGQLCTALAERLENRPYFFGDRPTELDALLFGHLFAILTVPVVENKIAAIVREHRGLVELVKRIDSTFFGRSTDVSQLYSP
ncbi:metaxin-2-like isoform X2 [Periplaneta americana]|uniref:metaxin-2-like isoform X2 n=1 Tax=Periplaneta americana TaxID=6978 RepID=UPI0037E84864